MSTPQNTAEKIQSAPVKVDRRKFLRYPLLGGMAFLGAMLALRSRQADPSVCLKQQACQRCPVWNQCFLPAAEASRKERS